MNVATEENLYGGGCCLALDSSTLCGTGSLPVYKPCESHKSFEEWPQHWSCICLPRSESTCRTPSEGCRERAHELRNARRREVRYMRKQLASVRNGEQDRALMVDAYELRVNSFRYSYASAERLFRLVPCDSFRARAERAYASFRVAWKALLALYAENAERRSRDRAC